MDKKFVITITGFAGFIGSHFTRKCLEKGWYVHGIDSMTYASNHELGYMLIEEYPNQFTYDIKDINKLEDLYECDYVVNFAASSHVDRSISDSKIFMESNFLGVQNLLEIIRKKGGYKLPTFIQISTDEIYGDCLKCSHKETDILKPSNPYAASKAAADLLLQSYHRTFNIPYLIIRLTNNYGIGQYPEKLIPRVIKNFNLGKKIELHNQGSPIRTWLHASDSSDAIFHLIKNEKINDIYNVSGGLEKSNIEIVHNILKSYLGGKDYKIDDYVDFSYNRPGQDIRYSLDDSKLRNLGWSPKKKFSEEIVKIVNYYKDKFIW